MTCLVSGRRGLSNLPDRGEGVASVSHRCSQAGGGTEFEDDVAVTEKEQIVLSEQAADIHRAGFAEVVVAVNGGDTNSVYMSAEEGPELLCISAVIGDDYFPADGFRFPHERSNSHLDLGPSTPRDYN